MGLDLEAWLRNDYVDMAAVSDYWRLSPWQANVELVHRYGKKVFACLSESRERDKEACSLRNSIESYRARVMQALQAGVDGIYLFNAQDVSNETLYNELGDPDALRALPKVYVSTARGVGNADFWMRDGVKRFLEREFVCPSRPRALPAGRAVVLPLLVGDEAEGDAAPAFVLKLVLDEGGDANLTVSCNGRALDLTPGDTQGEWLAEIARAAVRNGANSFSITADADAVLSDLMLWVFPPGTERRLDAAASLRDTIKARNERVLGKKE